VSTSDGRTALISGASRGIGLEIARVLAVDAIAIPCDVADPNSLGALVQRFLGEFGGPPDVIVNNAGNFALATVETTEPEAFRAAIDVNLVAPFLLVRAFLADMRARKRGHIVTIGSIADRVAFPENGAYAASKFGLRALHEVLRAELRGSGVRATLVSPGAVDTALWDEIDTETRSGFTPRRQMLSARAVADAVRYAVSQPDDVNVDELRLSRS
jgi:NADP-dependent 3-hydroxy acid dehydrogenase YdfG